MNLALPAPKVEEALAPKVEYVEPAIAEMARPSDSIVMVQPPPIVEPATTEYDTKTVQHEYEPIHPMSVEGMRNNPIGINYFESYAAILPIAPDKNFIQKVLPCLYGDRDFVTYGEAKKYCFIKGTECIIYNDMTDPVPLYKISLGSNIYAAIEDPTRPDVCSTTISPIPNTNLPRPEMKTVLLRLQSNHQMIYQFTFDSTNDKDVAQRFLQTIQTIHNNK
jgi:hypothetical protein